MDLDLIQRDMFVGGAASMVRTVLAAILVYAAAVIVLRVAGKRAIAKLSAFDFVITIALGSVIATTVLSRETPIVNGALGLVVLLALQRALSFATTRWRVVRGIVESRPRLLVHRGRLLEEALHEEHVGEDEVRAALRRHGIGRITDVEAVVLETDGSISVIAEASDDTALCDVRGWAAREGEGSEPRGRRALESPAG